MCPMGAIWEVYQFLIEEILGCGVSGSWHSGAWRARDS
jgi:hypothetical protein